MVPTVGQLRPAELSAAVSESSVHRFTEQEYSELLAAVENWSGEGWRGRYGDTFVVLIAHALQVQVQVHRSGSQSSPVGPEGARNISVYYNGHNHYEASLPPASESTTEHPREGQAANSNKAMKIAEVERDSTSGAPSDVTGGARGHRDELGSPPTHRAESTSSAHDEDRADAVGDSSDSVNVDAMAEHPVVDQRSESGGGDTDLEGAGPDRARYAPPPSGQEPVSRSGRARIAAAITSATTTTAATTAHDVSAGLAPPPRGSAEIQLDDFVGVPLSGVGRTPHIESTLAAALAVLEASRPVSTMPHPLALGMTPADISDPTITPAHVSAELDVPPAGNIESTLRTVGAAAPADATLAAGDHAMVESADIQRGRPGPDPSDGGWNITRATTTLDTTYEPASAELVVPPTRSAEVQLEAFRGHLLPDVHRPTDVETTTPATPPELSPGMLEVLDLVQWGVIQLTDAERQRFKELGVYVPPTVQWLPRRLAAADGAVPSLMYRSDDSDPHEAAYNEIAPGLERRVSRDHPNQSGLRYHDPELDFLTGFERQPDGRLSDEALVVYLRQQQSNLRRALVNLRYRGGVTLTGFDDDDAITADSFTPEQLSDHPELSMFLQRRAHDGGLHSDGNPDSPWEVEEQEYAGVRVRFYSMASDDTAAGRRELVARALLLLQKSGVDLPGRRNVINVHLPRYHRAVSVQAGDAGSNPNPTVRVRRTAGAITTGAREAEFFAPGDLVLTSGLVAPRPHGNPLWNQARLANRMDDVALGVVAGALMQLAHWSSSPHEYADLSLARLRIAASRIGNRLSERAGKNAMHYAAEFGLNSILGERHQPEERRTRGRFDRRAGDTEELQELNRDLGGPAPGRPVTAPTLSGQMLEDVISAVRRNVVLGWVTAEQVQHAEQTLSPPGVRWLPLPHRVGLIIDRLTNHFDRLFEGVRQHPGMGNLLFEYVAAEWAELWKTGATWSDDPSNVERQVAQIVAAMAARTTPLIERHWRHVGPATADQIPQAGLESLTPGQRRAELERLLQTPSASWSLREQHHDADPETGAKQSNWADRWTSGAAVAAHDLDVLVRAIRPASALSSDELDVVVEQVRQQVGLGWVTAEQVRDAEQGLQSRLRWLDLPTRAGLAGIRLGQHLDLLVAGVRQHPGMGNVLFEDVAAEWGELWKTGATSADLRSGVDEQVAQIVAAMGARTTPLIERHWRHDGPATAGQIQSDRPSNPLDSLSQGERRAELERLLQTPSAAWSLRAQHRAADLEAGTAESNWADRWTSGDPEAAHDLDVLIRAIRQAPALSSDELDVVVEQVRQQVGLAWVTAEQVRDAEQSLQSRLRWLDLSTRAGLAGIRLGQHLDLLVAGVRQTPEFRYVAFEDVAAEWGQLWKSGATSADHRSGVDAQVAQIVAAMGARTTPLIERGWRHDGPAIGGPIQSDQQANPPESLAPAEHSEDLGGLDRSTAPAQVSLGELAEKWADQWNSGAPSAAHDLAVLIRAGRPLAGTPAALELVAAAPDELHDEPGPGEESSVGRVEAAVLSLGPWEGELADCVVRVDRALANLMGGDVAAISPSRHDVGPARSVDGDMRPVDRVAARLGGRFERVDGVGGLASLRRGAVTPVWVERPGRPMHMVLVSRRQHDDGLVMVETQYRGSAVPIVDFPALTTAASLRAGDGGLPAPLQGSLRVMVNDRGRLVQLDLIDPARVAVAAGDSAVQPGPGVAGLLDPPKTTAPGMAQPTHHDSERGRVHPAAPDDAPLDAAENPDESLDVDEEWTPDNDRLGSGADAAQKRRRLEDSGPGGGGEPVRGVVDLSWIESQWDAVRGHPEFRQRLEAVHRWLSPSGGEVDYRLDRYRHEPIAQAVLRVLYMWHRSGEAAARRFADRQRVFRLRGGMPSAPEQGTGLLHAGPNESTNEQSDVDDGDLTEFWTELRAENARLQVWLEQLATTQWPDVSQGQPLELGQVLDERHWWRVYLDSDDHAMAVETNPDDPGAVPEDFTLPGIAMAYSLVLDDSETLQEPMDWAAYRLMRSLVNGSEDDVELSGPGNVSHQPLGTFSLARDMAAEHIGDRPLVGERSGIVDITEEDGELGLTPVYATRHLPGLVNAVFRQYYADIEAAASEHTRLRAIGRVVRTLQVIQPFPENRVLFNTHFLLPRLLLADGFRPVILPSTAFLFSGGFSLDHIATALRWSQDHDLTTGLDDNFGAVPLRAARAMLSPDNQAAAPSKPNTPSTFDVHGRYATQPDVLDLSSAVHRWLGNISADATPRPPRTAALTLSTVLPRRRWWRLYLDEFDHADALGFDRSNPGGLYDSDEFAGFQADMESAYQSMLDDPDVVGRTIDWTEYQRMYAMVTTHTRTVAGRDGNFGIAGADPARLSAHSVTLNTLADDLTDTLDGRQLVTSFPSRPTFASLKQRDDLIALAYPEQGELLLALRFKPERLPAMIDEAFGRYYQELRRARSEDDQLLAIARVMRTLRVLHPFWDGNGRLHKHLLLPRLLLANGFQPIIVPSSSYLFNGGFSLDQLTAALRWGQSRDLAVGLDDLRGNEPWREGDNPPAQVLSPTSEASPTRNVDLSWIDSQWDAVRGHPEFGQRLETVHRWWSPSGSELTTDDYRLDEYRHEPAAQAALRVLYMWHRSGEAAARRFAERQHVFRLRAGSDSFWAADDPAETDSGQSDSDSESSSEIEGARVWQFITRTHARPRPPDQLWTSAAEQQWAEIGADNARVRLWLEAILQERRAEWNEVSPREPVELKDVPDAREWWRLYLNSDDHAAALRANSADPGAAYEAVPGGFSRAGIEGAFESVLNDRRVLEQTIDWAEYRRMRALVTGSNRDVLLGGVESSEDQPAQHAGAPVLAHDMEYELIGDQWLVVPVDGTEDADEVAKQGLVMAMRHGERVILEPIYSLSELPELVDVVFEQYYAAIEAATSDFERLKAIGGLVRTLQVLRPLPDSREWLNTHFLLSRLLLANGFRPVILPATTYMFSGGFSLEHIATALRWGQEQDLTTSLDDTLDLVPLREPQGLLRQGGRAPASLLPNNNTPVTFDVAGRYETEGHDVLELGRAVYRWLDRLADEARSRVSLAVPAPAPAVLGDFLPSSKRWRLYLTEGDHAAALKHDRSNPGGLYDVDEFPGYQADLESVFTSVLDKRDVVRKRIDWNEYRRMYKAVTAQTRQAAGPSGNFYVGGTSDPNQYFYHWVILPELAADLTGTTLGGRPLVTRIESHQKDEVVSRQDLDLIAVAYLVEGRELQLAIRFQPELLPALVNEAFGRYYLELEHARSAHERLRAIARLMRTLSVLHPFRDGNGRLHKHLLLQRLLLANGFRPVILPLMHYLFNGGFSLDQITAALQWGQDRDLAIGLDDLRGAEPWLQDSSEAAPHVPAEGRSRADSSPTAPSLPPPPRDPESTTAVQESPATDVGSRHGGTDAGSATHQSPQATPGQSESPSASEFEVAPPPNTPSSDMSGDTSPQHVTESRTRTNEPGRGGGQHPPVVGRPGERVAMPGDGWCLLYSVVVGTAPEHWPASWTAGDTAQRAHAAIVAQAHNSSLSVDGAGRAALERARNALHEQVLSFVLDRGRARIPDDVTRVFRGHQPAGALEDLVAGASEADLQDMLDGLGLSADDVVEHPDWLGTDWLRARYITERVTQLIREGDASAQPPLPRMQAGAARRQAQEEVGVDEQGHIDADPPLGALAQFAYLQNRNAVPTVGQLGDEESRRTVLARSMQRFTSDEYAGLVEALQAWPEDRWGWRGPYGDTFALLVAHTLGVQLHQRGHSFPQVGPQSDRTVRVHYRVGNHYDASLPAVHTAATGPVAPATADQSTSHSPAHQGGDETVGDGADARRVRHDRTPSQTLLRARLSRDPTAAPSIVQASAVLHVPSSKTARHKLLALGGDDVPTDLQASVNRASRVESGEQVGNLVAVDAVVPQHDLPRAEDSDPGGEPVRGLVDVGIQTAGSGSDITTLEKLNKVVDKIVEEHPVKSRPDDPRDDLAACTILLGKAMRALHPQRFGLVAGASRTLDDSVIDGRPVSRLIGGAEPLPVRSWDEIDRRLEAAAGEDGRATALILVSHPNGMGHAVGAHRFANRTIAYFDLHAVRGMRVLGVPPDLRLARASAVILDGAGRQVKSSNLEANQEANQDPPPASVVDALIDPPGDRRYGRGGVEAEFHGGYLLLPPHLQNLHPDPSLHANLLNERVPWVAKNDRNGITVVFDRGGFDMLKDGGAAMRPMRSITFAPIEQEDVEKEILEFVLAPLPELRNDPATNSRSALIFLQQKLIRLHDLSRSVGRDGIAKRPVPLSELLPAEDGWELHPEAVAISFVPAFVGPYGSVLTHHTKGITSDAGEMFMTDIEPRIVSEHKRAFHSDGRAFGRSVVKLLKRWFSDRPHLATPTASDIRRANWAMSMTSVQVTGLALAAMRMDLHGGKSYSAIVLRQSLRTLRADLSPDVLTFLNEKAEDIRTLWETKFLDRMDMLGEDFSDNYIIARNDYSERHQESPWFHEAPTPLPEDEWVRPLDAVRYAHLWETHGQHTLRVGDYFDTMLLDNPAVTVNPSQALDVDFYLDDLDRERGQDEQGLVLAELRDDGKEFHYPDEVIDQYDELTQIVRQRVAEVEPPEAAQRAVGAGLDAPTDTATETDASTRHDGESGSGETPREDEDEDEDALRLAVDGAVARVEQRQPGGWTGGPVNCVQLVEGLREALDPEVHATRTVDDSALLDQATLGRLRDADNWSRAAEQLIAPGATWVDIRDWSDAESAARQAGRGSTVYVLMGRPSGEGHAFALRHTKGGRLFWVDPQMPTGERLLAADARPASPAEWAQRGGDQLGSAISTRILVVDRSGMARLESPVAERESSSTARAIIDARTDHGYGKGGFEKEKPRYRVKELPDGIHPNTKLVTGLVNLTTDKSSEGKAILESVSDPGAMVPGESGPSSGDLINRQREMDELLRSKTRVPNSSVKIKDIFSDRSKYTIKPGAEDIEVFADLERSDMDAVQYTGGTDADYGWAFLYRLRGMAFRGHLNDYLLEGLDFGRQMARRFIASPHNKRGRQPYLGFLVEALYADQDVAWVRSIATSAYLHNSGVLRWQMHRKAGEQSAAGPKNFTPAVSRVSPIALIKAASAAAQRFFAADPNAAREFFLQTFLANDRAARERFDQHRFSDDDLKDIRQWRTTAAFGKPGPEWTQYFDNYLLTTPKVTVDQYSGMGVRTRFAKLDANPRRGAPGLDLFELRFLDTSYVDSDTFEKRFEWLRDTLAEVHGEVQRARQGDPAKVWQSVHEVSTFSGPSQTRDQFVSALDAAWNEDQAQDSPDREPLLKTERGQHIADLINGLNRAEPATWHALIADLTGLHQRLDRFRVDHAAGIAITSSRELLQRQLLQAVVDVKDIVGKLKSTAPPWLQTPSAADHGPLTAFADQVVQVVRHQGRVQVHLDAGTNVPGPLGRVVGQREANKVAETLRRLIQDRLANAGLPAAHATITTTSRGSGPLTAQGYRVATDGDRRAVVGWVTVSDAAPARPPGQPVLPPIAPEENSGDLGMSSYMANLGGGQWMDDTARRNLS